MKLERDLPALLMSAYAVIAVVAIVSAKEAREVPDWGQQFLIPGTDTPLETSWVVDIRETVK